MAVGCAENVQGLECLARMFQRIASASIAQHQNVASKLCQAGTIGCGIQAPRIQLPSCGLRLHFDAHSEGCEKIKISSRWADTRGTCFSHGSTG